MIPGDLLWPVPLYSGDPMAVQRVIPRGAVLAGGITIGSLGEEWPDVYAETPIDGVTPQAPRLFVLNPLRAQRSGTYARLLRALEVG